jgi:hypothetical protein
MGLTAEGALGGPFAAVHCSASIGGVRRSVSFPKDVAPLLAALVESSVSLSPSNAAGNSAARRAGLWQGLRHPPVSCV